MKKLILILIAAVIIVTGCTAHNTNPKIEKWDNTRYEQFSSSVGIDFFMNTVSMSLLIVTKLIAHYIFPT